MEVHPHTHTERKKWYHYFWEFFMLFLAVTLGFLVENKRELFAEHKKEMQYLRSYIEDLHIDINQLDSIVSYCEKRTNMIDSLITILESPDIEKHGKDIYYYARILTINLSFFSADGTIQQLKYGGNLRLITKQAVSDAMMNYDHQVRWLHDVGDREEDYVRDYVKWMERSFDTDVFEKMITPGFVFARPEGNPQLLKKDKATILEFIGKLHFLKSANLYLSLYYQKLIHSAQETLSIIKKEYHLG